MGTNYPLPAVPLWHCDDALIWSDNDTYGTSMIQILQNPEFQQESIHSSNIAGPSGEERYDASMRMDYCGSAFTIQRNWQGYAHDLGIGEAFGFCEPRNYGHPVTELPNAPV